MLLGIRLTENEAWWWGYGDSYDFLFLWLIVHQLQPHRRGHPFMQITSSCVPTVRSYHAFAGSQCMEERVAKHNITIKGAVLLGRGDSLCQGQ